MIFNLSNSLHASHFSTKNSLRLNQIFFYFQFREAIQRIASPTHYKTTILLATIHLLLGFTFMGITTFSSSKIKEIRDDEYRLLKKHIVNAQYNGTFFNTTLENTQFKDTYFKNVTFHHMQFSHVDFIGCNFEEAIFSNVKSSITYFYNSTIKESKLISLYLINLLQWSN